MSENKGAKNTEKPGFFTRAKNWIVALPGRISGAFKNMVAELKKVVWYGKTQTLKSTGLVIVCLVVVSAVISLLDLGLSNLILWLGSLV